MFKDPFQLEETPYDLLGLEPNASPKEVQEALPRFMRDRKNLPRLALAQQAIRKLKTPADRAMVDIWLYNVEAAPEEARADVDLGQALAGFRKVPCYPVEELYSDLTGMDLSKEHYGLHGTPEPATIGRTQSHGCVRLTNWDALRVAALAKPGTPVIFKE